MKFSKKIMITMMVCLFVSGAIFTIVSSTVLKIDIDNAIETIGSIILYDDEGESISSGILTTDDNKKLKVTGTGDNFIINDANKINNSENSSILGGSGNIINGGNANIVYGGKGNTIESHGSFIGGGNENQIFSRTTGSVILGGSGNKINSINTALENSVVIGNNNNMDGSYSSVVGNNSKVGDSRHSETYNSVAMGSGAIVVGNNSFLRVDGSEKINLSNDDVFAVFSEKGMVINQDNLNSNAKFNVGGHFVISSGDYNDEILCGTGNGTGIIKVVDRDDISEQKCLCNCDGESWKSMIGDGQCESICKGEKSDIFPECVEGGIKIVLSGDEKVYSGECEGGSVIPGSYFVDKEGIVWWQCQGKNGNTTPCSYKPECTGDIQGWIDGYVQINNNIVPSLLSDQRKYKYSIDKLEVCTYSCITGYALEFNRGCQKVCDEINKGCSLGSRTSILSQPTYTNDYVYECMYDEILYKCEANCDEGKIWNGTRCVSQESICGTEKYTCLLGNVSNTGTDLENFTWECIDNRENVIRNCYREKEVVNRVVYYGHPRNSDGNQSVYFYMKDGDIPVDLKIKQIYYNNGKTGSYIYTIPANQKVSDKKIFDRSVELRSYEWYPSVKDYVIKDNKLYVSLDDKYYILEIEEDNSLCMRSCSTAGQCSRGALTRNYRMVNNITGNKSTFYWLCTIGNESEMCEAECKLDVGKCEGKNIQNSVSCDPSKDSECYIKGSGVISFQDFYMDKTEEKIVGSKCGDKRHCLLHSGYVSCTESIENCSQPGFKCNDGYVLSGCSCISITGTICNTTLNPGRCVTGMLATGYSKGEGKNNYSYYCEKEGMQKVLCKANCSNGKIWNGSGCVDIPNVCGDKHNNCINQSTLVSNRKDEYAKKYKRTCKLGNKTQECSECYTGYIMSGNECKVKPAINCETREYSGYKIPYLINGGMKQVKKNTRNSVCNLGVKCMSGNIIVVNTEDCRNVCVTGTTSLGTCLTGLSVNLPYIGNVGEYGYKYECKDNYGYIFDMCNGRCSTGEYRDGSKCGVLDKQLCGESHYDCINGSVTRNPAVGYNETGGYTRYKYIWFCVLGDYQKTCNEIVDVVHNCKAGIYSGYYVKDNLNHGQELSVSINENGKKCTATAVCYSGGVTIKNEDCSNACPGGIMDVPRCNFDGVNPLYSQSATWTSGYTYKCGDSVCSANCSNNKIWNGSNCVNRITACNNTGVSCNQGIKRQVNNKNWGYTWDCRDTKNENLNESICYKCNDGYLWKSDKSECEEKSCSGATKNGYNIPALSGSTNIFITGNIQNGSCNATANCSKGNLTITGERCTCIGGYYLNGRVCNKVCANGILSDLCNGGYTAIGLNWGNGYTLYGNKYLCKYGETSVQCDCNDGYLWYDDKCSSLGVNDLCDNDERNGCYYSYPVEQSGHIWGYTWKCRNANQTGGLCYLCNEGYDWDKNEKICKKIDTEPVCTPNDIQFNRYGNVILDSLCDSESEAKNWYKGDGNFRDDNGREREDGCGHSSYVWECVNKKSHETKRCFKVRDTPYFDAWFDEPGTYSDPNYSNNPGLSAGRLRISNNQKVDFSLDMYVYTDTYNNKYDRIRILIDGSEGPTHYIYFGYAMEGSARVLSEMKPIQKIEIQGCSENIEYSMIRHGNYSCNPNGWTIYDVSKGINGGYTRNGPGT